jgi:hypothetical protein
MELLKDYVRRTLAQLQIPAVDCHAQNNHPLHMALTNSADEDAKGKVQGDKSEYTMGATGDIPNVMLYLRKLTMKAEVDLKTMAPHIHDNLRSLGKYMQTAADSNIYQLNGCVRNQVAALSAWGESRCWGMMASHLSKLTINTTTCSFIFCAIKGGDILASVASVVYNGVTWLNNKWEFAVWLFRMTKNVAAFQTCTCKKRPKESMRSHCHSQVAILRHSTFACKTRHNKSRLKLALCCTILLVLIKERTPSSSTAFHEGVTINLESFLIAIDSGSTYYLSDRRLDFEGVLTWVKVKIQGVTDSKGTSEWKDNHGKRQVFNIPTTLLAEASLLLQHTLSGVQAIIRDADVKLHQGNCRFKMIKISQENNTYYAFSTGISQILINATAT